MLTLFIITKRLPHFLTILHIFLGLGYVYPYFPLLTIGLTQ